MLPGKKYTPDDYLRIAWRRRWFIVVPAGRHRVDDRRGRDVPAQPLPGLDVDPRRPAAGARRTSCSPTVTAELGERLNIISQQILSRTRLERIIQEFNLYERERERLIMEDVDRADAAGHLAQRRTPAGAARRRQRRSASASSRRDAAHGDAGHRAAGVAVRAGEPRGPRAARRPDESVPAGAARGGAAPADRTREEAAGLPAAQQRAAARPGRSRTCR